MIKRSNINNSSSKLYGIKADKNNNSQSHSLKNNNDIAKSSLYLTNLQFYLSLIITKLTDLSIYTKLLLFALLPLIIFVIIYLYTNHRIRSLQGIKAIIHINSLPKYNKNCKIYKTYNQTYYKCLPNVLFIGASKCGTTSMTDYLASLPSIQFVNRRIIKQDKHREIHRYTLIILMYIPFF